MRRTVVSFYALILLTEIVWTAIVPLAPVYARTFDLSSVETGAVLAAAGVATLAVSLPVGLLWDRVGARSLVIASSVVITLSTLGQALATDFWSLLLSRAACGIALGLLGSIVVMGVVGLVGGSINPLVPLQLRAEGLGPGATGLAMSASSLVFVAASAHVARRPGALNLRFVGASAVLYGLIAAAPPGRLDAARLRSDRAHG